MSCYEDRHRWNTYSVKNMFEPIEVEGFDKLLYEMIEYAYMYCDRCGESKKEVVEKVEKSND